MEDHRTAETSADLALAPILDVRAATALHRAFLERRGASIVVDASAVERIGGQCAAILLSAHRTFANDGHDMRVAEVSVGLHEGLRLLGIDPADIGAGQPDAFVAENQ